MWKVWKMYENTRKSIKNAGKTHKNNEGKNYARK